MKKGKEEDNQNGFFRCKNKWAYLIVVEHINKILKVFKYNILISILFLANQRWNNYYTFKFQSCHQILVLLNA